MALAQCVSVHCACVEDTANGLQLRFAEMHPVWHVRGVQRAVNAMSGLSRDHNDLPELVRISPHLPQPHVISLANLSQADVDFLRTHLLAAVDAFACTMDGVVRAYVDSRPSPPREDPHITTSRLREDPPDIATAPPILLSQLMRRHSEPRLGARPRH